MTNQLGYFERLTKVQQTPSETASARRLCVGLDPNQELIETLYSDFQGIDDFKVLRFVSDIIEATKDQVCAYKINRHFYDWLQNPFRVFEQIVKIIRGVDINCEHKIQIIFDSKIGDVPHTVESSLAGLNSRFNFDAYTINPYCGFDSISFLGDQFPESGFYVLVLTSNTQEISLQRDFVRIGNTSNIPLYYSLTEQINKLSNFGGVFGATNIDELRTFCYTYRELNLLNPGGGAQGGSITECSKIVGNRGLIPCSRSIIDQTSKVKRDDYPPGQSGTADFYKQYFAYVEQAARFTNTDIISARMQ